MTNRVSRQSWYDKPERSHVCPFCASYVFPFADGTNRSHCAKCGTVTHVSMLETDVPLFREGVAAEKVKDTHPSYDQLIHGAEFTAEHKAEVTAWWNDHYSDENVKKRMEANR